jgi:hypothetical protein
LLADSRTNCRTSVSISIKDIEVVDVDDNAAAQEGAAKCASSWSWAGTFLAISTLNAEAAAATIGVTVASFRLLELSRLIIMGIMEKI